MPDDVMNGLLRVGLSELEAKVYLALLGHYKTTAKELSHLTGIFRTQVYDVLTTLIDKGYCTEILDNVKHYMAVDPELAFQGVMKDFNQRLHLAGNLARQLHQRYISNRLQEESSSKLIEVIHSKRAVRKRLNSYFSTSSGVILSFNKPPYELRFESGKGSHILTGNRKQLVQRSIFQIDNENPELTFQVAEYFAQAGENVRITDFLPMKMVIFDNLKVFYQLSGNGENNSKDTATFIHHPEITLALINSFWVEWERSFSLEAYQENYNEKK